MTGRRKLRGLFDCQVNVDGLVKSPEFVMPVQDGGSGIQNILKLLDSAVRRNDVSKGIQTFNDFVNVNPLIKNTPAYESFDLSQGISFCSEIVITLPEVLSVIQFSQIDTPSLLPPGIF